MLLFRLDLRPQPRRRGRRQRRRRPHCHHSSCSHRWNRSPHQWQRKQRSWRQTHLFRGRRLRHQPFSRQMYLLSFGLGGCRPICNQIDRNAVERRGRAQGAVTIVTLAWTVCRIRTRKRMQKTRRKRSQIRNQVKKRRMMMRMRKEAQLRILMRLRLITQTQKAVLRTALQAPASGNPVRRQMVVR